MRVPLSLALLLAASLAGCPGPAAPPGNDAGTDAPAMDAPLGDVPTTGCAEPDRDGDGANALACGGSDCDDDDPASTPGAVEVCDALDHDEDCDPLTFGPRDADGDGIIDSACCNVDAAGAAHCGLDCDDARRTVSPDSPEVCNDVDDDCDGAIDEMVQTRYYRDDDVDGHGIASDFEDACAPAGAYRSTIDDDCDDADSLIHPGAAERCNALDDDCSSGGGAEPAEDADGDLHTAMGFAACETGFPIDDCDDTRALIHPGADFQPEPWCSSSTPCLEGGVWECGIRAAGSQACMDLLVPRPSPSWDYDCDGVVDPIMPGRGCFSDCLTLLCPATEARPVPGTTAACGEPVAYFQCTGDCACGTVDLGSRPRGCR